MIRLPLDRRLRIHQTPPTQKSSVNVVPSVTLDSALSHIRGVPAFGHARIRMTFITTIAPESDRTPFNKIEFEYTARSNSLSDAIMNTIRTRKEIRLVWQGMILRHGLGQSRLVFCYLESMIVNIRRAFIRGDCVPRDNETL